MLADVIKVSAENYPNVIRLAFRREQEIVDDVDDGSDGLFILGWIVEKWVVRTDEKGGDAVDEDRQKLSTVVQKNWSNDRSNDVATRLVDFTEHRIPPPLLFRSFRKML